MEGSQADTTARARQGGRETRNSSSPNPVLRLLPTCGPMVSDHCAPAAIYFMIMYVQSPHTPMCSGRLQRRMQVTFKLVYVEQQRGMRNDHIATVLLYHVVAAVASRHWGRRRPILCL